MESEEKKNIALLTYALLDDMGAIDEQWKQTKAGVGIKHILQAISL